MYLKHTLQYYNLCSGITKFEMHEIILLPVGLLHFIPEVHVAVVVSELVTAAESFHREYAAASLVVV